MQRLRLAYGPHPEQFGHLYLPVRPDADPAADALATVPVVVVVHGGYWSVDYSSSLGTAFARDLARAGVAAWNVEYRRVGAGGGWAETSQDMRAAVDAVGTLVAEAARDGGVAIDPARVRLVGHSAGGQLVVWVAGEPTTIRPELVVSQAGALDLERAGRAGSPALTALFGASYSDDPDAYRAASPLARVPTGVPMLAVHGADDVQVSASVSVDYVTAATAAGDRARAIVVPGEGHQDCLARTTRTWAVSRDAVLAPTPDAALALAVPDAGSSASG